MDKEKRNLLEEKLRGLIASHKSIIEKFVYYILAINAACIVFAINKTQSLPIGYDKFCLLAALLFWLISFCLGLINIKCNQLATTVNMELLTSRILEETQLEDEHRQKLFSLQKTLYKIDFAQNRLLGLGIIFYIIWHIMHMISNAVLPC